MISLFLLTFVYGSNAFSLNDIVQKRSLLHPIENSSTENHTSRTQTIFEKIETDPKGFVSEVQKLDPAALKNVISLLEELLASSEARETHLIDSLQDANTALDNANTNVVNALDDLTAAQARTAAAKTEQSEAEAAEAAIQTDLAQKRQVHNEKLTEQGTAQTAHDDEVPSLNNEQQVLTDVIAMLQGLPAEGKGTVHDGKILLANGHYINCFGGASLSSTTLSCKFPLFDAEDYSRNKEENKYLGLYNSGDTYRDGHTWVNTHIGPLFFSNSVTTVHMNERGLESDMWYSTGTDDNEMCYAHGELLNWEANKTCNPKERSNGTNVMSSFTITGDAL